MRGGVERDRCVRVIEAGLGPARAGDWSPDGTRLVVAGSEGISVRTVSGHELWRHRAEDDHHSVSAVAWSPDGKWIAAGERDGDMVAYGAEDGASAWKQHEGGGPRVYDLAWSPDGARLAAALAIMGTVVVMNGRTGRPLHRLTSEDSWYPHTVAWSPDGERLATGDGKHKVRVWDPGTHRVLIRAAGHDRDVWTVRWSPDGRRLASAGGDSTVRIWDATDGREVSRLVTGGTAQLMGISWSPDGELLAAGAWIAADDGHTRAHVWRAGTGELKAVLRGHRDSVRWVGFSPDGELLGTASEDGTARVWDVSDLLSKRRPRARSPLSKLADYVVRQAATVGRAAELRPSQPRDTSHPTGALPRSLGLLPGALALLLRLGISAPLSTLRALLALTGPGEETAALPEGASLLSGHPGLAALASLRWGPPARVAFLPILLKGHDDADFTPPEGASPAAVHVALLDALVDAESGGPEHAPAAPPLPVASLHRALASIDDRMLILLRALGEQTCADHPELPLSFLPRLSAIVPLAAPDRALFSIRAPALGEGRALGAAAGMEITGTSARGHFTQLVPWQWALPPGLRRLRAASGGLLFRARAARESPRLRPTVLVVDTSPSCFGPVDAMVRAAALAAANALLDAGLPAYIVAAGGDTRTWALQQKADAVEILMERSPSAAQPGRALARARGLVDVLRDGVEEPIVVVLSHPWFAAEEEGLALPGRLRGLFVTYPRHTVTPALAPRCDRWRALKPSDHDELAEALVELLG